MTRTTSILRKIAAIIIGLPLLVLGLILIPLPGPGFVVTFLALLILSSEFESLKPHRDKAKAHIKKIYDKAKERQDKINQKYK